TGRSAGNGRICTRLPDSPPRALSAALALPRRHSGPVALRVLAGASPASALDGRSGFPGDDHGTITPVTRGLNRFETISVAAAVVLAGAAGAAALASAANTLVFVVSAGALLVLAWIVGVSTEQLAASRGPKVGGVLNATFGNAAELIITVFAVRAGQLA